jgi:hypothetical protein
MGFMLGKHVLGGRRLLLEIAGLAMRVQGNIKKSSYCRKGGICVILGDLIRSYKRWTDPQ